MASASTQVRNVVAGILDEEFDDEGFTATSDKLDSSIGQGITRCAVYPLREDEQSGQANTLETTVVVQFFNAYDPQINAEQTVDPAIVEGYANRLKGALKDARGINDPFCWYFRVISVEYPDDPTGNKSRFVLTVRAFGQNDAAL